MNYINYRNILKHLRNMDCLLWGNREGGMGTPADDDK